jgi:hypothetical protein
MDTRRCSGTNKDGTACSAPPRAGSDWCAWHDPDLAEDRARWQAMGGRAKANPVRARKRLAVAPDLPTLDAALCEALTDLLDGRLEPGVASAAASLSRAIVTLREVGTIEARIIALEKGRIA